MVSSDGQTQPVDPLEDQLLSRARAGDTQAFATLLREHDDKMRGLAWKVLGDGDRDAMDDVLQDAYLKAFRSVARFRGDASFSTWLYRITYTTCIDHHRRQKRRRHVDFDHVEKVKAAPNMVIEGPSRSVTDRIVVQRALGTLSHDHRSTLLLVDGEGLSYLEAAEVMGSPRDCGQPTSTCADRIAASARLRPRRGSPMNDERNAGADDFDESDHLDRDDMNPDHMSPDAEIAGLLSQMDPPPEHRDGFWADLVVEMDASTELRFVLP